MILDGFLFGVTIAVAVGPTRSLAVLIFPAAPVRIADILATVHQPFQRPPQRLLPFIEISFAFCAKLL